MQHLKSRLSTKAAKTVKNILTVLNVMLKQAIESDVIERMPCTIKLLPVAKGSTRFYDFDEFERLVAAAQVTDPRAYLLVLMSGEAGLRLGEMVALEWTTLISSNVRCACSGQRGKGKSRRRRVAGFGTSRSRRDSPRLFGIIGTFAGRWCSIRTTDLP